jgi:hypothetical protein
MLTWKLIVVAKLLRESIQNSAKESLGYYDSKKNKPWFNEGCSKLLAHRKQAKLRVFENRVLRRILGPKRDEVMGEWRKLHNKELRDLYSSPSIIRMMKSRKLRWEGHVARMGRRYRLLVGKLELE